MVNLVCISIEASTPGTPMEKSSLFSDHAAEIGVSERQSVVLVPWFSDVFFVNDVNSRKII